MAWPKDPRIYGSLPVLTPVFPASNRSIPLLPTPNCPASYGSIPSLPTHIYSASNTEFCNLNFERRFQNLNFERRFQNSNNCPYNNFRTEFFEPEAIDPNPEIPTGSIGNDLNIEPIDPKLDVCSDTFNPHFFLSQPYTVVKNILPYPKAKEYNNLAEYYSHHILKKANFKKVEKDRLYDRDYSWYYKILGWDHRIQKRYEQRILRRTRKYAGWLTAKLRKYKHRFGSDDPNYEPCRSFPPLQSTKIIQTQSKFRKYKIFPRNLVADNTESTTENVVSDMPALNIAENTQTMKTRDFSSTAITSEDSVLSSKNV